MKKNLTPSLGQYFYIIPFSILTICLLLLVIETLLYLLLSNSYKSEYLRRNGQVLVYSSEWTRFDPVLGLRMAPNLDIRFHNKEFDTRVQTNSHGFRDDESSLEKPKLLFFGDSFCFGWGVDQGQTCVDLLEKSSGFKCLNLGTSGYGTYQQFLSFSRFMESQPSSDITAVFLCYPGNDLAENRSPFPGLYPTMIKEGSQLISVPVFEDAWRDWMGILERQNSSLLGRASYIWDFIRMNFYSNRKMHLAQAIRQRHPELPWGVNLPDKETLFRLSLERIKTLSDQKQIEIYFYLIPTLPQLTHHEVPPDWDIAKKVLDEFPFPVVDLSLSLEPSDYFPLDSHWNKSGHQKVAEIISPIVK